MSSTAVSAHLLSIEKDYRDVHNSVRSLSADWRKIGSYLGIAFNRLRVIESNRKEVDDMLMDMIAAWLEIDSETQPEPTWRKLCEAVGTINRRRAEVIALEHRCDCSECLAKIRNTPVAREVESYDVVGAAQTLKKEFDEMMIFIMKEVQLADAEELKYRINSFVKHERKVNETIEAHLARIEDFVTPSAILRYLYRHEFIGYINYALLKIVQEVMKSKLLEKHIEEYDNDYQVFLTCALKDIHAAFRECPDLQPNYPVGLPSFTIHLESDWDGRSMYKWKEVFERRFSWPETLNVVKISKNCIIITCTVWPKFAEHVVRDLTDPKVIADLKKEGVTIDISPQLLAYHFSGDFPSVTSKEVFASAEDRQGTMEQYIKGTSSSDSDDHSLAEDSTGTIPEVDTLPLLSTDETEPGAKESPLKDQPTEGIKPDWDEHVDDASGYVSMKQDSDGQTVTSGDTEGHRLVELKDDVDLKKTIDTYEHVVRRLLSERKSVEEQLVSEREMKKEIVMELEQTKEQLVSERKIKKNIVMELEQTKGQHQKVLLTEREKTIETMRRDNERLQQSIKEDKLDDRVQKVEQEKEDLKKALAAKEKELDLTVKSAYDSCQKVEQEKEDLKKALIVKEKELDKIMNFLKAKGIIVDLESSNITEQHKVQTSEIISEQEGMKKETDNLKGDFEAKTYDALTENELKNETGVLKGVIEETDLSKEKTLARNEILQKDLKDCQSQLETERKEKLEITAELNKIRQELQDLKTNLNKKLLIAASTGKKEKVIELIVDGANVEYVDKDQRTPLHYASKEGNSEVVEELLTRSTRPNVVDKDQKTPLHLAAAGGHTDVVKILVSKDAATQLVDRVGQTPVHLAAAGGHTDVVKYLLSKGAASNLTDWHGQTSLHLAAQKGRTDVVQLLISKGANLTIQDEFEQTPLHVSSESGYFEVVHSLIEKGANVSITDRTCRLPVHYAAELGDEGIVEDLLLNDSPIDSIDKYEQVPLHLAAQGGHTAVMKLLFSHGTNAIHAMDKWKQTPLHAASEKGHVDAIHLLISERARVDAQDKHYQTPLHLASDKGHADAVQLLLSNGADVTTFNKWGQTPLHAASEGGHVTTIRLLVSNGARIDVKDKDNHTPTHLALHKGHFEAVQVLQSYEGSTGIL